MPFKMVGHHVHHYVIECILLVIIIIGFIVVIIYYRRRMNKEAAKSENVEVEKIKRVKEWRNDCAIVHVGEDERDDNEEY